MNHIPFITNMDNTKDKGIGKIEIKENGKYSVMNFDRAEVKVEGGSPVPPVPPTPTHLEKGDIITLAGNLYRVLKAGETLEDVELLCLSTFKSSRFSEKSPSQDPTRGATFICGEEEKTGLKYEGSDLDTFCNETFLASLPEDVQDAIIEQEVVQEMYHANNVPEGEEADITFIGGGMTYRIKKASTESVIVGTRKIRSASVKDVYDYLGFAGTPLTFENWELNKMFFNEETAVGTQKWLLDAYSGYSSGACCVGGSGNVYGYNCTYACFVAPTFHINLTNIEFSK